jgi:hypothetical protein
MCCERMGFMNYGFGAAQSRLGIQERCDAALGFGVQGALSSGMLSLQKIMHKYCDI